MCDGEVEDEDVGLFIRNRKKEKIKIKSDSGILYFQTGEASQILSGGKLQSTPHAVLNNGKLGNVSRNTFGVFTQPREYFIMKTGDDHDVFLEYDGVPSLKGRWEQGITHGEFIRRTMEEFYN